jgi:hypothetical protein
MIKRALDAGVKVAAYTRNPLWWKVGITACAPYVDKLQFFCLDIEEDPGVGVTREMVDGVKAMGVRPVIYSAGYIWPKIMGNDALSFSDVPLWDAQAGSPTLMDPKTYTPNVSQPKPREYGGWNVPGNMRVGIQQTNDTVYNGINIDINSFSADFLAVWAITSAAVAVG